MSRRLRILLVDDSAVARRLVAMRLNNPKTKPEPGDEAEFEIVEAEDGESALARYQAVQPDLVLLDPTMPGMGGYETLKELLALDPTARVVVITADIQDEARRRVLAAGARGYITKPVSAAQLHEFIRAHA